VSETFDSAVAGMAAVVRSSRGVVVTYRRGEASAEVTATVGQTVFEVEDEYGVVMQSQTRDYLIAAADLVLAGQRIEPQEGDRIEERRDGKTRIYEVMAPGGEPAWRPSDPAGQILRIHTKEVATEDG